MLALVLAGIVLGSAALIVAQKRRPPAERPVRIEVKDRRDERRR